MRYLLLPAMLLIVLNSCNSDKKIRGDGIVPKDKMIEVIRDMHLVDAVTNDMAFYRKYNPGDSIDLYGAIFEKYGITNQEYERTIQEYSKHPAQLDALYEEVMTSLKIMQDSLDLELQKN